MSRLEGRTVWLNLGPGQHGAAQIEALARAGACVMAIRGWPDLAVGRADPAHRLPQWEAVPGAAFSRRIVDSLAYRAGRVLGRKPDTRGWAARRQGRFAARRLGGQEELLLGWSQVSVEGFRSSGSPGLPRVLEHPTIHMDAWQERVAKACADAGVPVASSHASLPASIVSRVLQEVDLADVIILHSTFARETFLQAGVAAEKLVTIPLGVDPLPFAPNSGGAGQGPLPPRAGPPRVLYLGRMEVPKGVPDLLEAFRALPSGAAELVLVGHALSETEQLLGSELPPGVRLLPPVERGQIPSLMRDVDVVVFPSRYDAFGLVILEGMAAGKVVVATTASAGPDIIEHGEDGWIVRAGDVNELANGLRALVSDAELRQRVGARARETVLAGWTLEHYEARVVSVLSEILA